MDEDRKDISIIATGCWLLVTGSLKQKHATR